jgi:membrane fusion protein (multidrug efflux system)
LVKISPLKLEFSIPERYADQISVGFPVSFSIEGMRDTFIANIYAIEPKVDIETKVTVVRAKYANKNEELKPGRYAKIYGINSRFDNTVSVPTESIIAEMDGEKVFVYKKGKAEQRKVVLGLRTEAKVQVLDGLQFGDTLLTTAILQLRQNLSVQLDTLITNEKR